MIRDNRFQGVAGNEDEPVSMGLSSHKSHCDAGHFGCVIPGTGVHDKTLGYNGSFEIERAGLPVNWTSSRYPLKNGDAEFSIDTADAISGDQSLKILVRRLS